MKPDGVMANDQDFNRVVSKNHVPQFQRDTILITVHVISTPWSYAVQQLGAKASLQT